MSKTVVLSVTNTRLKSLARLANQSHQVVEKSMRDTLHAAMVAGQALDKAFSLIPYGDRGPWLRANFAGSERAGRRYIRLYRERDRLPGGDPLKTGSFKMSPTAALGHLTARRKQPLAARVRQIAASGANPKVHVAVNCAKSVTRANAKAAARLLRQLADRLEADDLPGECLHSTLNLTAGGASLHACLVVAGMVM